MCHSPRCGCFFGGPCNPVPKDPEYWATKTALEERDKIIRRFAGMKKDEHVPWGIVSVERVTKKDEPWRK